MNIRLYKFTIIIEFILVILFTVVLFTNPFWIDHSRLEINSIHPNEFYVALSLLFILLTVSFLTSLAVTAVFKDDPIENKSEQDTIKKKRNFNFWKFTFLTNLSFVSCLLVYSLFEKLTSKHTIVIYEPEVFLRDYLIFTLVILMLSLFIGALCLSAGTLWRTNRLSSSILGIAIILFFFTPFFMVSKYKKHCENIHKNQSNKITNSETEETGECNESYYSEDDEDGSFSFAELWEDPSQDESNVLGGLESFLLMLLDFDFDILNIIDEQDTSNINKYLINLFEKKETIIQLANMRSMAYRYLVDYETPSDPEDIDESETTDDSQESESEDYNPNYEKLLQMRDEINRDPEKMKASFEKYNHLLYSLISPELYKKADFDKITKLLILSHDDIYNSENPEKVLAKIYSNMLVPKKKVEYIQFYYKSISPFISDKSQDYINYCNTKHYALTSEDDIVWIYSFWARRDREGNSQEVYNILTQIKEHYEE